jgi:23S rRNA (cytidine1920-2'-O)/16S rRNA (cytidine1409-2'-O)-methyltransferase
MLPLESTSEPVRPTRVRLDKLLVDRQLVPSRERAQALILAGRVLVDEQKIQKSGNPTLTDAAIRLLGDDLKYVGRGGLKLERALEHWGVELTGKACADIGASTGGFTDCMLQAGAARVLAIDTGYGQIAEKLRSDGRVTLMERTNARLLEPHSLAAHRIEFFAVDVSFISATLVLPAVLAAFAQPGETWKGEVVLLIKPQFEAGREHVGKGGIVRTQAARQLAINRVAQSADSLGAREIQVIDSPIKGMEGNHEYLLHAAFGEDKA